MNQLVKRVFCSACGAIRVRNGRSRYAVCPKGHGRLVSAFTKAECRQAIAAMLPLAQQVGRNRFLIAGREGLFAYRSGSGRRRVEPDATVQADEVMARHVACKRVLVRVFARKAPAHAAKGSP